jgi:hypothetical protein
MGWAVSHGRSISRRSHGEKTKEQHEENRCASVALPEPNAAGVDVGATEIYIAVPVDRDPQPVRHFSTFTEDLHAVAAWLKACKIVCRSSIIPTSALRNGMNSIGNPN